LRSIDNARHGGRDLGVIMAFERLKLGELLLKQKLVSKEQLNTAIEYQKSLGGKIGNIVVKLGFLSDEQLTRELAHHYGMEVTDLANQILPLDLLKQVPRQIIEKHELIPVHVTGTVVTVAMSDPTDYEALDELQFATGKKIETTIATRDSIKRAIAEFLAQLDRAAEAKSGVAKSEDRPGSAGKLRPASAGSLKALAESTESSLVENVKRKIEAAGPKVAPNMLTRAELRAAVVPLLLKKGVITEGELFDAVVDLLKRKGVLSDRELVERAKDTAGQ
jgi:Type II secretion system (T2SS), protein E, N-terminal domain